MPRLNQITKLMKVLIKSAMFVCMFVALSKHSIFFMFMALGFYLMNEQMKKEQTETNNNSNN